VGADQSRAKATAARFWKRARKADIMGDLSFAMIGAGFWAQYQLAAWQQVPGARCVAVCDQDQAKAARLAEQYRVPRSYSDAATMMKQPCADDRAGDLPPAAVHLPEAAGRQSGSV
jgi:ornithine cyclodeaminase/alanine dehydrogenase-like protein (mu-crystallin family)